MCCVAGFGVQISRPRIMDGHEILAQTERGMALRYIGRGQQLICKTVLPGTSKRSCDECSIFGTDHQSARHVKKLRSGLLAELRPQVVCALKERHVHRMLEVHLADDATVAVRGSIAMTGRPSFQAKHAPTTQSKMRCGCTSHRAKSGDDHIVVPAHVDDSGSISRLVLVVQIEIPCSQRSQNMPHRVPLHPAFGLAKNARVVEDPESEADPQQSNCDLQPGGRPMLPAPGDGSFDSDYGNHQESEDCAP